MSDTVMIAVSPIPIFALLLLALFKSFFFFLKLTFSNLVGEAGFLFFFFVGVVFFVFVVNAVLVARIACTIAFKR